MLVALVGATGSGKSTALELAKSLGYSTINMDRCVHELYERDKPGYLAVKEQLGNAFVNEEGVDRKRLAEAVFADQAVFERLKKAVYPLLVSKLRELKGDWVIEMPAYTNDPDYWRPYFGAVVLVRSPSEQRRGRLLKKMGRVGNFSTSDVGNYLNLVNPSLSNPDYVVDNSGSLADFHAAFHALLKRILDR